MFSYLRGADSFYFVVKLRGQCDNGEEKGIAVQVPLEPHPNSKTSSGTPHPYLGYLVGQLSERVPCLAQGGEGLREVGVEGPERGHGHRIGYQISGGALGLRSHLREKGGESDNPTDTGEPRDILVVRMEPHSEGTL